MSGNYPPGVTGYERIFQQAEEDDYCSECGELADDIKDGLCKACGDGTCSYLTSLGSPCGRRGGLTRAGVLCLEHERKMGLDPVSLQRAAEREIESRRYRKGRIR